MSVTEDFEDLVLVDRLPENDEVLQRSLAMYRYENTLVKTELSATLEQHAREMEELRLKYQAQVREVERQRTEVEARLSEVQEREGEQLRKMQQTNLQLQQKIKMLQEDIDEGVCAREKLGQQKQHMEEQLQHIHLSHQAAMETLKGERNQLNETVVRLRGELDKERIASRELTTSLSTERHQHHLIKSRVTEVEQQCRVQLTSMEAEMAQLKQEREADAAAAVKRVEELDKQIKEERRAAEEARQRVEAREVEVERNAAEERQTHLTNAHQLTLQNAQLQEKIKTLEGKLRSVEEVRDRTVKEAEAEVERATEGLHKCECARAVLEGRLAGLEGTEEALRQERQITSTLRQDLHLQQTQVEQLSALTTQLHQTIHQLKNKVSEMEKQGETGKEERERRREAWLQEVSDLRSTHHEEVEQLRARVMSLQTQMTDRSSKYLDECSQLKQKVRTYARLIKKLRHRVELGGAEMERLAAQRAALEADCVPSALYARLQTRLRDLTRRHNEFAAFITGLGELQCAMPEISQLTMCMESVGQNLSRMEEEQKQCLSELESL